MARRELKSRDSKWAQFLSKWVATKTNITPNAISVISVFFSLIAFCGYCLYLTPIAKSSLYFILPIIIIFGIQMRLICNLIDGMVAVEGGKKSITGGIYNEFPDRLADTFIIVGAGIAGQTYLSLILAIFAALLAVLTAYTRLLGGTLGAEQYFSGPMAKQHRMAFLTGAAVVSLFQPFYSQINIRMYPVVLGLMCFGCVLTVINRLLKITKDLKNNAAVFFREKY